MHSESSTLLSRLDLLEQQTHARISELEKTVAALRPENERLSSFYASLISTLTHVEDVVVGRLDVLEQRSGRRSDRVKVPEEEQGSDSDDVPEQRVEGGWFLNLSDPLGLRKLGGLPSREGYRNVWGWVPVRLALSPSLSNNSSAY